jgi:hypothetical protein
MPVRDVPHPLKFSFGDCLCLQSGLGLDNLDFALDGFEGIPWLFTRSLEKRTRYRVMTPLLLTTHSPEYVPESTGPTRAGGLRQPI